MNSIKSIKGLLALLIIGGIAFYFTACSQDNITSSDNLTDDQYLQQVVQSGTGSNNQAEEDLMANESGDMDNSGAVPNNDNQIDTLIKWGRKITGVNVNYSITSLGDTEKTVNITRTISGNYIIIGNVNGTVDTIVKPYTEVLKRYVAFKRIARTNHPRFNWKLYQVSMADAQTTAPQVGSDYVKMTKLEVYDNGSLKYTLNGPDFTQDIFTTIHFGGAGVPSVNLGDQVRMVLYTNSSQTQTDIVAWHWARNTFGFHREPFTMTSNVWDPAINGYDRTYEKTFTIYMQHKIGIFNGYLSASTHQSLYDSSPNLFASDELGTPYKVLP